MTIERRSFLGRLSVGMLALVDGRALAARGGSPFPEPETWLDGLNGKHKQYFDVAAHKDGQPLGRVANFLNAYNQAYALKDAEINVVFGAHGTALPIVINDAFWAKYRIGTHYSIVDPTTKAAAVRNIFAGGDAPGSYEPSVATLQKRGVRFIACKQSVSRLARELSAAGHGQASVLNDEILANLLPRVIPVPAAILAGNRAQESGLTYVYLG
jgi:intracellular sulfur oxidation DsrE/DsrF family protein